MTTTEMVGFVGVGLAGIAYLPQITHLIKERCSAGVSRLAFGMWLVSSFLVTAHAVATHAAVFVVLGAVQIVSTAIILIFGTRYHGSFCPLHRPCPPAIAEWVSRMPGTQAVPTRALTPAGVRARHMHLEESP